MDSVYWIFLPLASSCVQPVGVLVGFGEEGGE